MPSQLHEALLYLFRNCPLLAPQLLREALHRPLPPYAEARVDSADLTEAQPAEYRAGLVVSLLDGAYVRTNPCLGGGSSFMPLVLGPSGVPEVTDESRARQDPELAALLAMAHERSADTGVAVRIAAAAQQASLVLDEDRLRLYFDLVLASLSKAARQELQAMDLVARNNHL